VERRKEDNDFDFDDLKLFHKECYGGRVDHEWAWGSYVLFCYRCGEVIDFPEEWMKKIVCTAVDGKERKLSDNVRAIQKIKTKSKKSR
jgi:hypothetical protein